MRKFIPAIQKFFFASHTEYYDYLFFFFNLLSKFILFDIIWCTLTSFQPFSWIEYYSNKLLLLLILMLPFICFSLRKSYILIAILLDLFLISNLLYLRTYYTAIPLSSYSLIDNLNDFTASVFDSFRWTDLYFPLSTIGLIFYSLKHKTNQLTSIRSRFPYICRYLIFVILHTGITIGIIQAKGGFIPIYERLLRVNTYACGTTAYTLFGTLYYQYRHNEQIYSSETEKEINEWLSQKPEHRPLPQTFIPHKNCLIILVESLESWVLEKKVEDIEITPCLNALIRGKNTLYAPYVQTQVRDGRSIDGQLLLHTGLYPIQNGTYSIKYPQTLYPSLAKALKRHRPTRATCMIIDHQTVWNSHVIEPALGFDTLLYRDDYILDEKIGNKRRLSDGSFFRQCEEKLKLPEICPDSVALFIQCVTITGHNPFYLPEKMRRVSFSKNIPQRMKDYMTVANYTDHAIGKFIDFLRSDSRFSDFLIVITGDHEGLADTRSYLCHQSGARGIVSPDQFTPFIVVNSPIGMRYEKVMGQIDMYPTLLNLLGLDDYEWTGLGQSILDPDKKSFAIDRSLSVIPDSITLAPQEIESARKAWKISDLIIRHDYFRKNDSLAQKIAPVCTDKP